ncbi:MAG: NADH:ubiquinone oxidoreductase subunit M [Pirellulaceae bacterium]|nr:MAG: NADH:ubiquinone oxidoreductase subunit M [Pirellulaceae bacterium]
MGGLLVATLAVPFLAALLVAVIGRQSVPSCRWIALAAALLATVMAGILAVSFEVAPAGRDVIPDQFVTQWQVASGNTGLDVRFSVALDGIGLWLFVLSAVLLVTSVLVSWESVTERPALYYSMLLLLTGGCLGVFAARDIILFYIFFEFTLVPLFFLIGIWGSEERWYAAVKFFLFTLAGSVFTFLGLLAIVLWDYRCQGTGTLRFDLREVLANVQQNPLPEAWQWWVFLALFAGFAIKVPLVPLHTWLPLAHVQAPTAGSVFLAGILLKIGTYGFLQFCLPLLPHASAVAMPWVLWLSVVGIVYGALVCLAQRDLKRLVAYSSVSHLGFCMLGIFALTPLGVQGGALQMINHGISTGALFALVGMLYDRYHTRQIHELGGLSRRVPWLAFFMVFFTLSSIGLPGTNGFAGEFLLLTGMFQRAFGGGSGESVAALRIIAVLATSGVVLGAWYMLGMVQRVFFGPVREPHSGHTSGSGSNVKDLSWREVLALAPLAVLVLAIGLYPKYFLDRMAPSLGPATAAAAQWTDRLIGPAERRAAVPAPSWLVVENANRVE